MKTQKTLYKFFIFFIFLVPSISYGQSILNKADSLYAQQEYIEAFRIYEKILTEKNKASASMFIKMAFIQEGLGNYDEAIYYLLKYHYLTYDPSVLQKISNMAEENDLHGYEFNDFSAIKHFFFKYQKFIAVLLLIIAFVNMVLMLNKKRKGKRKLLNYALFNVIVLVLIATVINISPRQYALFKEEPAYVMGAPSPGAEVISISEKGHRVRILKKNNTWYQVKWHGEKAYIRDTQVRLLYPKPSL